MEGGTREETRLKMTDGGSKGGQEEEKNGGGTGRKDGRRREGGRGRMSGEREEELKEKRVKQCVGVAPDFNILHA